MKISYKWLKDYLDFDLSPEELSVLLTDCGLEIEGMEKWQSVKGGLEGLVIGEVIHCKKHPDADRLSLTEVSTGGDRLLPIVCGAPNVAKGQKVVVATVGTILYSGDNSFEIKKAKIRGQVSEGMICAEDEIGMGSSHEGIMVLDENATVGTPVAKYFDVEEDYIFEIGLTPNRTDAMSHIGVARDVKAVLENKDFISGRKGKRELKIPSVAKFETENTELDIPVEVQNPEACPRYSGVTITGIAVKESPVWLQNRLNAIGVRPINNIVDITNYVLHETGQPLHAFDADQIRGGKVIVKKMNAGTPFITLDEIERKLSADDLMICDTEKGMCIGGVFGGIQSGVTEKTTAIFLESAYFDPVHIRKTSKYHDLQTDASFRFERGVDPEITIYALKRTTLMIKELAGGTVASEIKDVLSKKFNKVELSVKWDHIKRLIGKDIGKEIIKEILQSLDFKILDESEKSLQLSVPLYRVDVTREADVIEEILRIYGYNNVELSSKIHSSITPSLKPDPEKIKDTISEFLCGNGFTEIMNNSLSKSAYYSEKHFFDAGRSVNILNPLSKDLNVMRQSLLFGGLETILYNQNRKNEDIKIFETGQVYASTGSTETTDVTKKFDEKTIIGIFTTGKEGPESWYRENKDTDLFSLKSTCENLLLRLGIEQDQLEQRDNDSAIYKQAISYYSQKELLLTIGTVSDKLTEQFELKKEVFYAEINFHELMKLIGEKETGYTEIPRFPEVRRDLALLVDQEITFSEIKNIALSTEKDLLRKINLFDVYEGENIEQGKKSYAVSFILLDEHKTLTDKVIDKTMKRLIRAYEHKLNATIR